MKYTIKTVRYNMQPPAGCSIAEWYNGCERGKITEIIKYQNQNTLVDWKIVPGVVNDSGFVYPVDDLLLLIECDDNTPDKDKVFEDLDTAKLFFGIYCTDDWRHDD